jgi:hypothetical protein
LEGEVKTLLLTEPWFIATLVVGVGVGLWVLLCALGVYICRRQRRTNSKLCKDKYTSNGNGEQRQGVISY